MPCVSKWQIALQYTAVSSHVLAVLKLPGCGADQRKHLNSDLARLSKLVRWKMLFLDIKTGLAGVEH